MRLTIAYSKIKKRNLVLIYNATHQRETLTERPIRLPIKLPHCLHKVSNFQTCFSQNGLNVLNMFVFQSIQIWNNYQMQLSAVFPKHSQSTFRTFWAKLS